MKKRHYILPLATMAGLLCAVYASDTSHELKAKAKAPACPPAAQAQEAPVRQLLSAANDGIPYGLHAAQVDNKAVSLAWNTPEATEGYFDDFEGHADFVINSAGSVGWSYLDMDNQETYTWAATVFPNQGQKMAFIVMNPSKTTPSTADWPSIQPYSGQKMLAAFAVDGGNNDYLISPELAFEEEIRFSFRAKSYTDKYGLERIRVGYSTTGKNPSDFTFISNEPYEEVPDTWTLKEYVIPAEAKYVALNCVSADAFMLLIDDVYVGVNLVRPQAPDKNRVAGFNLYRNGQRVNDTPIPAVSYVDNVPDYADYTYTVKAVRQDGTESEASDACLVSVPDIRLLPFEDDFSSWTLDEKRWELPADDQGRDNRWKIDYYVYGLVDPTASYGYSSLTDYNHSLVTTELHTTDPDNTYLRFNLRLINYNTVDGDYLAVEVAGENGQWKTIDIFDNAEGSYLWRVKEYCLKDFLDGELFRIRFRAYGADAYYLDYWYVDDVKIWNPDCTTAQLRVTSQGAPMAQCPVHLEADHGATVDVTTDDNGMVNFGRIEKGSYTVRIDLPECNLYKGHWNLTDENTSFDADVTRPILTLSATEIHADLAVEEQSEQTLRIRNDGNGPLSWTLETLADTGSGQESGRWTVQKSFDASGDLQSAVAFDGAYFYTTSSNIMGRFYQYGLDGQFIEEFTVEDIYYKLYDLAFDGRYFYASDYSNTLYQMDFRNRRLVKTIVVDSEPDLKISHCCYDPRYDELWVGGFNSIGRIDRNGTVTRSFQLISNEVEMAAFGSAFDNVSPGGPYLWIGDENTEGTNTIDQARIVQYDLTTGKLTGLTHHVGDIPGYQVGSLSYSPTYITGVEVVTNLVDGTASLIGVVQQSPSRIFAYKLCNVNTWLSFDPKGGTLAAGEEQTIHIKMDARNSEVGQTLETKLMLHTLPQLSNNPISVSHTATTASATPRPVRLNATASGEDQAVLTWEAKEGSKPTGYAVYRNGTCITPEPIVQTTYTDRQLVRGDYVYTVTALYTGGKESVQSDPATLSMKVGAAYYPPVGLTTAVRQNRYIDLNWQRPDHTQRQATMLRWDNGTNEGSTGSADGSVFWAAVGWDADELTEYRQMVLDSVQVFFKERCTGLRLRVYQDDTNLFSQTIDTKKLVYGEWNTLVLTTPVVLKRGYAYKVALQIAHDQGTLPLGYDNTKVADGKGNLISNDGVTWYPATHGGLDSGNFNIAACLSPSQTDEEAPTGYLVYRDGQPITPEPVNTTSYTDEVESPGTYVYQLVSCYADGGRSALSGNQTATLIALTDRCAPSLLRAEVERNNLVRLHWNYPLSQGSSFPVDLTADETTDEEGYPEYVHHIQGAIANEYGVASDGTYIYTSVHNAGGTINRYALDGTYLGGFIVNSGMNGIRNMAYDGTHFYAVDNDNAIYQIDMEQGLTTDTIHISEVGRHLAYIADLNNGKGGFEVGDWETSIYVSTKGAKLGNGLSFVGASGTAYHNGTLYAMEQGKGDGATIYCYDWLTGEETGHFSLKNYAELGTDKNFSGGGLSVVRTKEGLTLLAVCLQRIGEATLVFLELEGVQGVVGYNLYRNGQRVNDEPLVHRFFQEEGLQPGTYTYEVETVYIDGSTSDKSTEATIEIYDAGECDAPVQVQALPSASYPYNVILSFVDPTASDADQYESAESGQTGAAFSKDGWENPDGGWTLTADKAYEGAQALHAAGGQQARLVIPVETTYAEDFSFSFAASTAHERDGLAHLKVYVSTGSNQTADFVLAGTYASIGEAWERIELTLPKNTRYIALVHEAGTPSAYVDALAIHQTLPGQAFGYDILRDGHLLNESPIRGISYTDCNLPTGDYHYQVRAHYLSSCISDYSEPTAAVVDYDNNCQQPGVLSVNQTAEGNRLEWTEPALGDVVNLSWHNGGAHDAAGMPSGGCFFAGVQWQAEDLTRFGHLSLSEVEVYINQVPDALFVLVYLDNVLVCQQYAPSLRQYSFNTIRLDKPVRIDTTKRLRVVVYVEHNEISVPLGYDAGPAKAGKGNLYSSDGINWETLADNDIDGNWCITLGLQAFAEPDEPKAAAFETPLLRAGERMMQPLRPLAGVRLAAENTSARNTFDGYNVYCNGIRLNDERIYTPGYTDASPHASRYLEYQVAACYSGCGEVFSNTVRIVSTDVETAPTKTIAIRIEAGTLLLDGAPAGSLIRLTDVEGRILRTLEATGEPTQAIDLAGCAPGIYLISIGEEWHKFVIGVR